MRQYIRVVASLAAAILLAPGCSDSGGRKAVFFASTSSTSAPTTSVSTGLHVASLRAPQGLVVGDVSFVYRLVDPTSAPADVTISYSVDGGQSWLAATAGISTSTTTLSTGPNLGAEHTFVWTSATDIATFEPSVLIDVTPQGGSGETSSVPFAVDNQPISTHVTFNRRPFLQSTTRTETLILWRTDTDTDTVIEYGPTFGLGMTAGDPQASTRDHEVRLTGLTAGQRISYRILAGGLPITQRISFNTAPPAGSSKFTFLVVGDSGMNNPEQLDLARLMNQERDASLFLLTGDVVYPAGGIGAAIPEYNARFFRPYEAFLERMPAWPVVGNHDMYGLMGQPFKDTFHLPDNGQGALLSELYYAFEWGDCKFIALETNFMFKSPIGPHITWLRNELSSNTKKWLIVFMHTPLYSSGDHGDNPWLQLSLGALLESSHVDLVLTGHDHNWERTIEIKRYNRDPAYKGLVHIVTGGGGADLRPVNPNGNTAFAVSEHHYTKIRIDGDWLYGQAIGRQGQVIDAFAIQDQ